MEVDMQWDEFARQCPDLASMAADRFARDQLVMLGTIRRDGSPRISPCELDITAGHLFLGMKWHSPKALDLLRDPRLVVHSVTCNREGTDGDIKLYGRAVAIDDSDLRTAYRAAIKARIDWEPEEGTYHLFTLDVQAGGYVRFEGTDEGTDKEVWTWNPTRGLRKDRRPALEGG
jgi:hypothetical protein